MIGLKPTLTPAIKAKTEQTVNFKGQNTENQPTVIISPAYHHQPNQQSGYPQPSPPPHNKNAAIAALAGLLLTTATITGGLVGVLMNEKNPQSTPQAPRMEEVAPNPSNTATAPDSFITPEGAQGEFDPSFNPITASPKPETVSQSPEANRSPSQRPTEPEQPVQPSSQPVQEFDNYLTTPDGRVLPSHVNIGANGALAVIHDYNQSGQESFQDGLKIVPEGVSIRGGGSSFDAVASEKVLDSFSRELLKNSPSTFHALSDYLNVRDQTNAIELKDALIRLDQDRDANISARELRNR